MEKISDRLWVLLYREQYQSLLNIWTESRSTDEIFLYIFVPQSFFPAMIQLLGVFAWILNTTKKTVSPNPPWYFSRVISSMTCHSAPNCHFSLTSDLVVLSFSDINQHKRDWQRRAWFWAPWWGWFGKNPRWLETKPAAQDPLKLASIHWAAFRCQVRPLLTPTF